MILIETLEFYLIPLYTPLLSLHFQSSYENHYYCNDWNLILIFLIHVSNLDLAVENMYWKGEVSRCSFIREALVLGIEIGTVSIYFI